MATAYHSLPSDIWGFDANTPKGYYLNRGVFLFGRMLESKMAEAEKQARKNRKGVAADRLANGARIGILQKYLGAEIQRFRDPAKQKGAIKGDPQKPDTSKTQDEVIRWKI
ncbi:tail assembly chaperone [Mycobacterium phage Damien]|uniref:tail assembly chaperone n=1 Tax=Mycobacterium phage Damien TaxID=1486469 RepID=UPI000325584F|nr:tail assembly chaperone [Mycobacterium phage Damien]AHZ95386.1 tail assembly chaperone [Mycobacterium phage Damien]AXH47150.1 tail assembly chaperone [Mycobacterium phage Cborch11]